jgi:hypothetical protein
MSYATPAQAATVFQHLNFVPGSDSQPTQAQIQEWLDLHTVVLNSILKSRDYTPPTDANSQAYKWCVEANRLYVGAQIAFALSADQNEENSTGKYLKDLYDEMLKQLANGFFDSIFADDSTTVSAGGSGNFPDPKITWDMSW